MLILYEEKTHIYLLRSLKSLPRPHSRCLGVQPAKWKDLSDSGVSLRDILLLSAAPLQLVWETGGNQVSTACFIFSFVLFVSFIRQSLIQQQTVLLYLTRLFGCLYFLLFTFSKRARYFSLRAFEWNYWLVLFCVIALPESKDSTFRCVSLRADVVSQNNVKDATRWSNRWRRVTWMGRKMRFGVSYLQTPIRGIFQSLSFPTFVWVKMLNQFFLLE